MMDAHGSASSTNEGRTQGKPQGRRRSRRRSQKRRRPHFVRTIPSISYPDLPVSERREDIKKAIEDHQVVIIAGETGSGKTSPVLGFSRSVISGR